VRRAAASQGVPALLLDVRCPESKTLERIEARTRDPHRISDAGVEVYFAQKERYEPPREWPEAERIEVDTGDARWRAILRQALSPLAARTGSPR
jgi:predicted kinase